MIKKYFCLFIFSYIFSSINGLYFIWEKIYTARTGYAGYFEATYELQEVYFAKIWIKWRTILCDTFGYCDGMLYGSFCMLHFGCLQEYRGLLKKIFPNVPHNPIDLYPFKLSNYGIARCDHYMRILPSDTNHFIAKDQGYPVDFSNVMNLMVIYLLLLDDDYPHGSNEFQGDYYTEFKVATDLPNIFHLYTRYLHSMLWHYRNFVKMRFVFACQDGYFLPHCIVKCKPDKRRVCNTNVKYLPMNNMETLKTVTTEVCINGWRHLHLKLVVAPRCQTTQPEQFFAVKLCIFLEMCDLHACPFPEQYCIVTGNNSFICESPDIRFTSNLYPKVENLETLHVTYNELIKITMHSINNRTGDSVQFNYCWVFSQSCDYSCVVERNRHLLLNKDTVNFSVPRKFADFNFYVNYTIFINNRMVSIYKTIPFIYFAPPQSVNITNEFYICSGTQFYVDVDTYPRNYFKFKIWINNEDFGYHESNIVFLSAAVWSNALIKIVTYYTPNSYINYTYTIERLYASRPYIYFDFGNDTKNSIFYGSDTLICRFKTPATHKIKILIYSTLAAIDSSEYPRVHFRGFKSGAYKILCVLDFPMLDLTYVRYKNLFIFEEAREVCFVPFATIRGSLIRCATNKFPFNGDLVQMKLMDNEDFSTVAETDTYFLRLPYIMKQNGRYSIYCYYQHLNPITNISLQMFTSESLVFMDTLEVFQAIEWSYCSQYAPLPQEYQLKSGNYGALKFYVDNFYLQATHLLLDVGMICLFFIILFLPFLTIAFNSWIWYQSLQDKTRVTIDFVHIAVVRRIATILNVAIFKALNDLEASNDIVNFLRRSNKSSKFSYSGVDKFNKDSFMKDRISKILYDDQFL